MGFISGFQANDVTAPQSPWRRSDSREPVFTGGCRK